MKSTPSSAIPRALTATTFLLSLFVGACSSQPEPAAPIARAPAPEPEPEPIVIQPGPSAAEIRQAVDNRNDELRRCYMVGTFRDSQLSGTVNVVFIIDTTGKVSRANDAGSDMPDPEVVDCVLGVFAQLEFPSGASSATEVTYPITFGG
jgi:outer membrane biosynthesis protein TonB